jgi:hypothetical protein
MIELEFLGGAQTVTGSPAADVVVLDGFSAHADQRGLVELQKASYGRSLEEGVARAWRTERADRAGQTTRGARIPRCHGAGARRTRSACWRT